MASTLQRCNAVDRIQAKDATANLLVSVAWRAPGRSRREIAALRALQSSAPGAFRFTYKWVPVDLWSAPDVASLREAVTCLRDRIAPGERWRITVERRARGCAPAAEIIAAVADLVERKVDLARPDKVLLIEVFDSSVALAVVTANEVFTVGKAAAPERVISRRAP
jgi:hypothetical protein